jgi:Bifunctional DNA primase/polymerase, N-terminal
VDAIRDNLRAWALHFAARGWHVFPITPGAKKPPVVGQWETRASTDPDQINRWWQVPYTIGIATGPSGLVVIDLDTTKPGETVPGRWATLRIGSGAGVLRALARQQGTPVTPTYAVSTPPQVAGTCTTPPRPGRRCATPKPSSAGRSTPGRTVGTSSRPAARCLRADTS